MKEIYLDHAATTPVDERVIEKMLPYFGERFGNPHSPHAFGRRAAAAIDAARDEIASLLGARSSEIYFTSGGTEADNWAVRGSVRASGKKHFVVGATEHHAVLEAAGLLKREGYELSLAPVDEYGAADVSALQGMLRADTALVAVMAANNEVGTVQPLKEIAAAAHGCGALFFTDAVQAAGALELNVNEIGCDLLSLSSHKFYGPKGAGALYVRAGTPLAKLIAGGQQERGLRGGTLNVPSIVGMAEAFRLACKERQERTAQIRAARDAFVQEILQTIPGVRYNGHPQQRLPGNAHFTFEGVAGDALLAALDLAGVAASGGAACSSGSAKPSHVLLAMGRTEREARAGVRFTFGKNTSEEEALRAAQIVRNCVRRLRSR